jgi:hypothetical protein
MILEVEIGDKTNDLIIGLTAFIKTAKDQLQDGFQPGDDIPELAISAFQDLTPALMGVADLKAEFDSNPDSKAIAMALLANELMSIFQS